MTEKRRSVGFGFAEAVKAAASVTAPDSSAKPRVTDAGNHLLKGDINKLAAAELELKKFEGALPARKLDPKRIRQSKWANRHQLAFESAAFEELRDEIKKAGGNVQPIKVRALPEPVEGYEFEVVFGHRRHRACLDLGLPVLAIVEDVSDTELFVQMFRENLARSNLSAYEQGLMYDSAISTGLFKNQEEVAKGLGVDKGNVSKAMFIAQLEPDVLAAFPDRLGIQFRWSSPLRKVIEKDPEAVRQQAQAIAALVPRLSNEEVFEQLTNPDAKPVVARAERPAKPESHALKDGKRALGSLAWSSKGDGTVKIKADLFKSKAQRAEFEKGLRELLAKFSGG